MADFKEIDWARKTLGLGEYATMEEIEQAYKKLALKYHPDRCPVSEKQKAGEVFKEINRAKDILLNYCAGYRFSFKEQDVQRSVISPEYYQHLKRFYDGWWGELDI